jgi:hypothetical protein
MLLRFLWLTLFILGVRRAFEIVQSGAEELIDRIEEGGPGGPDRLLTRLHEALHQRQSRNTGGDDAFGEM